jgi:Putative adhesin
MLTYETPRPVTITLSFGYVAANVRITASDRADTTVDVQPTDAGSKADVKIAEQTRVEQTDSTIVVKAPKLSALFTKTGSIDVTVELPAGSAVNGESGMGEFVSVGPLGECKFKTGLGDIRVEEAETVALNTGMGDVTLDHAGGPAEVKTSSGALRVVRVDGPATVKNSNGESWIGEVTGDLQVRASNGSITVERARADANLKTANGSVRVGEVFCGSVELETAAGRLEVGVHDGTAAWLDLQTVAGRVHNELDAASQPASSDQAVSVRARTSVGDIVIRRSQPLD